MAGACASAAAGDAERMVEDKAGALGGGEAAAARGGEGARAVGSIDGGFRGVARGRLGRMEWLRRLASGDAGRGGGTTRGESPRDEWIRPRGQVRSRGRPPQKRTPSFNGDSIASARRRPAARRRV